MRKILCVADQEKACFYYVKLDESFMLDILDIMNNNYSYQKKDNIRCQFYDKKHHSFGIYDRDIRDGKVRVIRSEVLQVDRIDILSDDVRLGSIAVEVEYKSQIAENLKQIFISKKDKIMDFTKLIKVAHEIGQTSSRAVYLNDKEKRITPDEFKNLMDLVTECLELEFIDSVALDGVKDENSEKLKRFAIGNGEIMEFDCFAALRDKVNATDMSDGIGVADLYNFMSKIEKAKKLAKK